MKIVEKSNRENCEIGKSVCFEQNVHEVYARALRVVVDLVLDLRFWI